ncbi:acetate--CoA ligase family protein [Desulfovibrio litoralis]|uniref:Acetyltransferase n=1 Tax=Desulfovibrio litoralis DSM 11393 TaxID=1121455 RepID=A0A1M7RYU5_9BACT|nr:acetate--CoA ligase [Desulfovibrio litoralis]SHN51222.1 acetyltransferase [Desulfovibrio litoralis DSM 11393]
MAPHRNLEQMFNPSHIAIIGASATSGKVGHTVLLNLITAGYKGKIYPVNPNVDTILGLPTVRKINDLPQNLDMAVLCIPSEHCLEALEQLAQISVKSVVIISAGFKEVGGLGWKLEEEVIKLAKKHNIAVLGPNCLGYINIDKGINVTFAEGQPKSGTIGFFSQSGALCIGIIDWSKNKNIGFSHFISVGNKAVIDESDILTFLANDPNTKVIVGYLESVENGSRFLRNAEAASAKKPVILLRAGSSNSGAKAASSHTGALAGRDAAYEAAFKQSGILRAREMEELFQLAQAFALQPIPLGPNIAVVTNSGGPGIVAADACEHYGLTMTSLKPETIHTLKEILPSYAAFFNPVDVLGDATPTRIVQTVKTVLADEMVHSLVVLLSPTAQTPMEQIARELVAVFEAIPKDKKKPIFCCFMGGTLVNEAKNILSSAGYPCYDFPEPAMRSAKALFDYKKRKEALPPVEVTYRRDKNKAESVIKKALREGSCELAEFQAQGLLEAYELPTPTTKLCRTSQEAMDIAHKIGFPVVMKIASPHILHKSDVGGVVLNIKNKEEAKEAFLTITSKTQRLRPDAHISGCLVQAMAPSGSREVIVGVKRDPQFGPLVLFGLGGIHVETLKDFSTRLAPLTLSDAHDMIREIKAYPILAGMRGEKPINFNALEDILLIMSQLALDFPLIEEAEFNPVLVNEKGALVADIRIILAHKES